MNTQFERSNETTIEWYTPPEIIRALGVFDLDPCSSEAAHKFNHSAQQFYTKEEDGLIKKWFGRIWLNPPYTQPIITKFIERLALHGNGIALLYNRCDNKMFHNIIFPKADSICFLRNRISFYRLDGTRGNSPGCGSILVAFGEDNTKAIQVSGLKGTLFRPLTRREIVIQQTLF